MLRFLLPSAAANTPLSRREWLRIGGFGLGSWLAGVRRGMSSEAAPRKTLGFGRAKSVLLVYCSGGQSQLETWDPKPEAPREIRGDFASIATSAGQTRLCEHLPRLAQLADRYAIVRSMSHDDLDHGSASYLALTGRFHARKSSNPPVTPNDFPTYGAVLERVRPATAFPYTAVHLNGPAQVPVVLAPGQFGGFLGRRYEPLILGDVSQSAAAVDSLDPLPELPPVRLAARQSLLANLEAYRRELDEAGPAADFRDQYAEAFRLLESHAGRTAFDLSQETAATRDAYGRYRAGQACLLARRLVEAEVPLVTVIWSHSNRGQDTSPDDPEAYGWDTHNDIFHALKTHLLPRFDRSVATLLADLEDRGLLEQTLVVCFGEFGRAPQLAIEKNFAGASPGRKHWASAYSIMLAGAGVSGGLVLGASDAIAGHPDGQAYSPADLAATIFAALGIDPAQHYEDPLGRPFMIAEGKPMTGLYG